MRRQLLYSLFSGLLLVIIGYTEICTDLSDCEDPIEERERTEKTLEEEIGERKTSEHFISGYILQGRLESEWLVKIETNEVAWIIPHHLDSYPKRYLVFQQLKIDL